MTSATNTNLSVSPGWTFTRPARPLVWLITGCSSGLGLALARHALAAGHTVVATSRDPSCTPDLVQEFTTTSAPSGPDGGGDSSSSSSISSSSSGKWLRLDVDDPDAPARVLAQLDVEGLAVDVLVNNAGWSIHQTAENFAEEEVRRQFETVFFGPYRLARAVLPGMRARRFGVVVNISSGAGLEGRESMGIYSAAKAAMDGLTKVMAKEVAEFNIRTLTVFLGGFDTSMPTKVTAGKEPLPDDYKGTTVGNMVEFMSTGKYVADGDPVKAAKAIYEVVVGEGVGAGKEAEIFLPLGRDMEARVKLVRDRMDHCWDVFGDVAKNVYIEK